MTTMTEAQLQAAQQQQLLMQEQVLQQQRLQRQKQLEGSARARSPPPESRQEGAPNQANTAEGTKGAGQQGDSSNQGTRDDL